VNRRCGGPEKQSGRGVEENNSYSCRVSNESRLARSLATIKTELSRFHGNGLMVNKRTLSGQ
jgi:hypothetical protein